MCISWKELSTLMQWNSHKEFTLEVNYEYYKYCLFTTPNATPLNNKTQRNVDRLEEMLELQSKIKIKFWYFAEIISTIWFINIKGNVVKYFTLCQLFLRWTVLPFLSYIPVFQNQLRCVFTQFISENKKPIWTWNLMPFFLC